MKSIGLIPFSTRDKDKSVGQNVGISIVDGEFINEYDEFIDKYNQHLRETYKTTWDRNCKKIKMIYEMSDSNNKKSKLSRARYKCKVCDSRVWGKSGLNILCGQCNEKFIEE